VLPQFNERLSAFARSSLDTLGVEVHTDSRGELIDGDGVVVNGERIAAGTVLWAALPSWPGLSGPPMITVMRECSWVPPFRR
jgi:NADH dehydrogenase FAD-containing subunit